MTKLKLIDKSSAENIPEVLKPLVDKTIQAYLDSHADDLVAIYVHGSAVRGDWQAGKSDLDTCCIIKKISDEERYEKRRKLIDEINQSQDVVPYVEAYAMPTEELGTDGRKGDTVSLAATGVCVWGEPIDFAPYLPTTEEFTNNFIKSKRKYLNDLVIAEIKSREQVSRRTAKFAVRTMTCVALLRGAELSTAFTDQIKMIEKYVPELEGKFTANAIELIESDSQEVESAIKLLEQAIQNCQEEVSKA